MLAANTYPQAYVDACRRLMDAQMAAYKALKPGAPASAFEALFFTNLILALDRMFMHRTRAREGKDGNALNEVRMLCDSILENGGILAATKTIKYDPAKSTLGIAVGSEIKLTQSDFARLAKAFFAGIEAKFT